MRIAYLSSRQTLPDSPERRSDAFEHDQMSARLDEGFAAHSGEIVAVSWDDEDADWRAFDAALIGSAWDYQDRIDEFLARLEAIEQQTPLFNASALVRWNSRKTYLRELGEHGALTIPTFWPDQVDEATAAQAFAALASDDLVFKRQIGAGAEGQYRLRRGDPLPVMPEPMMVQPFLPSIAEEGEYSFVFIDGTLSHALLKTAAPGDYRVQSIYGGDAGPVTPSASDREAAETVLTALDEIPLYARVDMVRGGDGSLLLMELELIEPFLYPLQGEGLGARICEALARRLATA
jgi:glutathione synthase/RimK-type ligase-like ATP-grasp enzyme